MTIIARIDQYGNLLTKNFDEITTTGVGYSFAPKVSVTGVGTFQATQFYENVGVSPINDIFIPYDVTNDLIAETPAGYPRQLVANTYNAFDPITGEYASPSVGPGNGAYMRHTYLKEVVVYDEINEIDDFYDSNIITSGLRINLDAGKYFSYPGSGTQWFDISGNGNNGNFSNNPIYSAENGGKLIFNGSNTSVNVPANASNILTTLTMESWFKPTGTPGGGFHALFQKEGGFSGGSVYGLRALDSSTFYAMICYNNLTESQNLLYSNTVATVGNWYHVVSTFDSSYNWKIYINGSLENSSTLTNVPYQNSSAINIGTGDSRYTNGEIPVVRVYNRVLSAAEIQNNFDALRGRFNI